MDDRLEIEVRTLDEFWKELWAYLKKIDRSIKNADSAVPKISEFRIDEKTNYIIFPERLLAKQGNLLWNYINYKNHLDDFDPEKLKNALFDAAFKVKDINGESALHWAVEKKDKGTIDTLLKTGTAEELFLQNNFGETALHIAVQQVDNNKSIPPLIKKGGAELCRVINSERKTALHLAVASGNSVASIMLVEKMPAEDLIIKDNNGLSALDLAIRLKLDDIVAAIAKKAPYNEIRKYKGDETVAKILDNRAKSIRIEEVVGLQQNQEPQRSIPVERNFKLIK